MHAPISSSILLPVTPAITTPTTYFRKHRIFEHLSQTRCFGSGWEPYLALGQSSKKFQKLLIFSFSFRNVRGYRKCVYLSLGQDFLFFHSAPISRGLSFISPAPLTAHFCISLISFTFGVNRDTAELSTGNSLEMEEVLTFCGDISHFLFLLKRSECSEFLKNIISPAPPHLRISSPAGFLGKHLHSHPLTLTSSTCTLIHRDWFSSLAFGWNHSLLSDLYMARPGASYCLHFFSLDLIPEVLFCITAPLWVSLLLW